MLHANKNSYSTNSVHRRFYEILLSAIMNQYKFAGINRGLENKTGPEKYDLLFDVISSSNSSQEE